LFIQKSQFENMFKLSIFAVICQLALLASFQDAIEASPGSSTRRRGLKGKKYEKKGKNACPADEEFQCLKVNVLDNIIIDDHLLLTGVVLTDADTPTDGYAPNTQMTFHLPEGDVVTALAIHDPTVVSSFEFKSGSTTVKLQTLSSGSYTANVNGIVLQEDELKMWQNFTHPNDGKFNFSEMTNIILAAQMIESRAWEEETGSSDGMSSQSIGDIIGDSKCRPFTDRYYQGIIVLKCYVAAMNVVEECKESDSSEDFLACINGVIDVAVGCVDAVSNYYQKCFV